MKLSRLTSPSVPGGATLLVPLGSTEQHGPHLPLGTDTLVASALCDRLAASRPDVVVAPALPYGSSGEHAGFPGTLSIGQEALERVVVELVRSADAFAGVVLVSGHGGNGEALSRAVATLTAEGRRVRVWAPRIPGGDAHAGHTETSLLLALDPRAVREDRVEPGATEPLAELMPALRTGGVRAVSANGVLGDPTRASADDGERLLETLTADLAAAVGPPPPTR
ncbi:mycofactocin biosynthesis peptidyl-dipeptidase MftE [Iamia sp. SCSIO 61187]|uniref:mycofactocin biosynthesis peptidyl-dipeptidase MftE n=1 Tax=Iamia sp. SCSIO 61187 TaxID=2722752 RepID=UPI0021058BC7|nr:mycofactocin biosynthesis peptidyl-dipeptidase MftE [Iamia sp. SCSIO 61187]QYG91493.1 mycofactocin biosynthesis peptidyl-dipeptidase MftE [Iamia sp. SCSIO 61187]